MSGTSTKSKVIALRLPNEIVFTLLRRIDGRRSRWDSLSSYLRDRIIYDTERLHIKRRLRK